MVRPFSIFSPTFAKIHQSSMSSADYVRTVGTGEGQGGWVRVHDPPPDFARSVNPTSTKAQSFDLASSLLVTFVSTKI